MAIHTFGVTVETCGNLKLQNNIDFVEKQMADEIASALEFESTQFGIISVKVVPITGTCRQQLIGEDMSND